ncbi:MAG: DUF2891 domain-containing protein [Acidobacteriota bacterium]|nr:DUF2891 domain-containing protein [Acidobacteriota bacterium]
MRRIFASLLLAASSLAAAAPPDSFDEKAAARFAGLALACVGKEYPNKIAHTLESDEDAKPPRLLTPVFFGCYDWHSSVHGHWLLARLARQFPESPFAGPARSALRASFTPEKVSGEVAYLTGKGRGTFERPYGLAWLLRLCAELRSWDDVEAKAWAKTLEPLERAAASRLGEWLPKLAYPIREGEHAQTAFAFGLVLDWARVAHDAAMERLVVARTRDLYAKDRACPIGYEPSGQDFLSPCLAEADLMRRILAPEPYASWLRRFLPGVTGRGSSWLQVAVVTDPSDGKLAHLDGLNLSRAWMLEGIAASLPQADPRLRALRSTAAAHRDSGLAAVTGAHYEGGHWLGTFAVYLVTGAGLPGFERAIP